MDKTILIIGAGIGGLSAAIRLAQQGYPVKIMEARSDPGGLASGFAVDGFHFDSGPYILLDKPGLSWACSQLGIDVDTALSLSPIPAVYQVQQANGTELGFHSDLSLTAQQFEACYKGSGQSYRDFVANTYKVYQSLQPLTFKSHPRPLDVLMNGSLRHVPFMLRSLGSVLHRSGLPAAIQKGIGIWTYVSGQALAEAPSPMAFVPALMHNIGAYYVKGGMQSIAALLTQKAISSGVEMIYNTKVKRIRVSNKIVEGVETDTGPFIPAKAVVSNAAGVGTYTELIQDFSHAEKAKLESLPLQSPGVGMYLAVKGKHGPYYIQFKQNEKDCVAFVQPGLLEPEAEQDGWFPARLIAPLGHEEAVTLGIEGQQRLMENLVQDDWWQKGIREYRVLHRRTTFEWGKAFHLYRNSMNPVMTAAFMRRGRLAHRSPFIKGLYLAGSATHPGQWVSFCAVSGILAANCLIEDKRL